VREVPVFISGGGSVGLSLAAELGWRGIECLAIEQSDKLNSHPRANAVANRTMEYYRRWGIDQAITNAGIPPDHPADYYWVSSLHGKKLYGISLPPFKKIREIKDPGGYAKEEHTWSPYLKTTTGQNEVEKVLFDFINQLDCVDFRFQWQLTDFQQDAKGVTCFLTQTVTGKTEHIRARYLLACDGGHSMVRERLNIKLDGHADMAQFVSIYFKAPDFMSNHKFGNANIYFPLHRKYAGYILNWDGGTTFTYHLMLRDGQNWNDIDPVEAITAVIGRTINIDILSIQPWTAHALTAKRYNKGRAFLVGDAAHLFTPTGGFGMNTGVSDAIDLAWKIQAVLEGWGGTHLLDTYSTERQPVGLRNTMEAADCFNRLSDVMKYGDELDLDTIEGEQLRNSLALDLKGQEKLISSSGTLLGYRYTNSPIIIDDGSLEPADDPRTYVPTARPGHRAPHIWINEGVSILDLLGTNFTLLCFNDKEKGIFNFLECSKKIGIPLTILRIHDKDAAELYENNFVLVRPDLMVAWRTDGIPENPEHILNIIRGTSY
jgi:2-polyprenyl-6-methoxyphenol hydroxylase-like FAD-dependent oxidoreductase